MGLVQRLTDSRRRSSQSSHHIILAKMCHYTVMRMRSFLSYLFTNFFTIYEKIGPAKTGPAGLVPMPLLQACRLHNHI